MSDVVKLERDGDVAVLRIDNPPVNAISHAVREGIVARLAEVAADEGIRAVVLAAAGRTFPTGADIREFGQPAQDPTLPEVCAAIENSPKPVVAALHGNALGGGLELALAAHARVAAPGTRLGLPEVRLGILPGAGGTQRLPRITGAEPALKLILGGQPIPAKRAQRLRILDGVGEDPVALATDRARTLAGSTWRRTRDVTDGLADPLAYTDAVASAREAEADARVPSRRRIVECIEAAQMLPFDQGLAFEREAFLDCRDSPEGRALRHVFLAERAAAKPPRPLPRVADLRAIGILGGGTMGAGIALAALMRGLSVVVLEIDEQAATRVRMRIAKDITRMVNQGRVPGEYRDRWLSNLTTTTDMAQVAKPPLVIEAVPDDLNLKTEVLNALSPHLRPRSVIATNTSYLDVEEISDGIPDPTRMIGLHFFSPAHRNPLVEIIATEDSADEALAAGQTLARQLRKTPVWAGNAEGFVTNAILTAYRTAADHLMEDGASPYAIDAALRDFGFKLGPFQVLDLAGLDISWRMRQRRAASRPAEERYVTVGDRLVDLGRLGQKTGQGYYTYSKDAPRGAEDPELLALVETARADAGVTPRDVDAEEIVRTCLLAMVNRGGHLLDARTAQRAGDIDVATILGLGFPREVGGPMQAIAERGLQAALSEIEAKALSGDPFWQPSRALRTAAERDAWA
ncbi:MAG: 3-hydroxyacyl-CoA dehydrogenase NAD-binding domain-containing protein [Shimia sp.]